MYPNYMIKGGGGDDTFNVLGNLTVTIDGGEGTNIVTGATSDSTLMNVVGANTFAVAFERNETKTLTIDGKEYIVTNTSGAKSLNYKIASSGAIEFSSSEQSSITIKGQSDKSHNVILKSNHMTFYGGDKSDNIIGNTLSIIYAGGGDDVITSGSLCIIYAQSGNNLIKGNSYDKIFVVLVKIQ